MKLEKAERFHRERANELAGAVERLEARQRQLKEEAVRAEALEERGWQDKAAAADKIRPEISSARAAIEKALAMAKILGEEKVKFRDAVRDEIQAEYRQRYCVALRKLHEKLKAAAQAEGDVIEIEAAAADEFMKYLGNTIGDSM